MADLVLFSSKTNQSLAQAIADQLNIQINMISSAYFKDGEVHVALEENLNNLLDKKVLILHSSYPNPNDKLIELILITDALKSQGVKQITALIPYFSYARQESSAQAIIKILATAGINKVLTTDIHNAKILTTPFINLQNISTAQLLANDLKLKNLDTANLLIVSPDVGGILRAQAFAQFFDNTPLVNFKKQRITANNIFNMQLHDDPKIILNKHCILVDDLIDTAGTICQAAALLKAHGGKTITAYCTHAVLSGNAVDKIMASCLDEVVVTNSISLSAIENECSKIRQLDVSSLLIEIASEIKN